MTTDNMGVEIMNDRETKSRFFNMTTLKIVGVLLLFFSAIVLL